MDMWGWDPPKREGVESRTEELVARIGSSGIERVVSHKEVILPQLCAPFFLKLRGS